MARARTTGLCHKVSSSLPSSHLGGDVVLSPERGKVDPSHRYRQRAARCPSGQSVIRPRLVSHRDGVSRAVHPRVRGERGGPG